MTDSIAVLSILVGLELVLSVDNILVISIFVLKLEKQYQNTARILGLSFALLARILLLLIILQLASLTDNIFLNFSIRDLILIAGGLFLLWKAVSEIHNTIEFKDDEVKAVSNTSKDMSIVVLQIVLLDIVFSFDSVITAIGLTDKAWIIIIAVILSFSVILMFAKVVGDFIINHPTLKILALSFLITIGITIFMEGLHKHVPKAYIYLPMGFALLVELLQLRYEYNRKKIKTRN